MKFTNPRTTDKKSYIDVDIETDEGERFTFCCMPDDPEKKGSELYARASSGEFGTIKEGK